MMMGFSRLMEVMLVLLEENLEVTVVYRGWSPSKNFGKTLGTLLVVSRILTRWWSMLTFTVIELWLLRVSVNLSDPLLKGPRFLYL